MKYALVTGGSRGIGRAVCVKLIGGALQRSDSHPWRRSLEISR